MTADAQPELTDGMGCKPLGLLCGGHGTPLGPTWIDLDAPQQVLYGLNGAGKTTVLDSLQRALTGLAGGGRMLTRLAFDDDAWNVVSDALSLMLVGDDIIDVSQAHREFVGTQEESIRLAFEGRRNTRKGEIRGTLFERLNWDDFLYHLATTEHWLFTPTGRDTGRWSVNPVVLVEPASSRWAEHLEALKQLDNGDEGILLTDYGLDLLWDSTPPDGAPIGIIGTLVNLETTGRGSFPYWPFGNVVTDDTVSASDRTRLHLLAQPSDRWGGRSEPLERDGELRNRVAQIQGRANLLLSGLLADAPALQLDLGDEAEWFAGHSCSWSAKRFEGDTAMGLSALSWAEKRWADIAINLAIAEQLNEHYGVWGRTWLVLDEPERGLHRTAEAHMAKGVRDGVSSGLRTFLATHSPELLDHSTAAVSQVRRRSLDRPGAVVPMRDFDAIREELGLNRSDMLRRTRGIALLEGEHDTEVLAGMLGPELDQLGVMLLPTRGASRLKTVVDSRFLYEFTDAVLFPILDDLGGPVAEIWDQLVVMARTSPSSEVITRLRRELKELPGKGHEFLEQFLAVSLKNGTFERVQPLGIPQTDVLLCLPAAAFVPTADSWRELRDDARRSRGGEEPSETDFKDFLKKSKGADLSAENIRRIAELSPTHPDIKALLAAIARRLQG